MDKVLFSKQSDDWATPIEIYNHYMNLNFFDPCPYQSTFDGLQIDWNPNRNIYINPPYSNISAFVDKALEYHKKNNSEVVLLIPSRTDTRYFHKLLSYGIDIQFVKGRLKFNDSKNAAPFPSVFIRLNGISNQLVTIYK